MSCPDKQPLLSVEALPVKEGTEPLLKISFEFSWDIINALKETFKLLRQNPRHLVGSWDPNLGTWWVQRKYYHKMRSLLQAKGFKVVQPGNGFGLD